MRALKNLIRKVVFKFIKPPFNCSNSQAGEDKIVDYLFSSMGIWHFSYLDIGTGHPEQSNNTYFFYRRRNRGVLVEPDSGYFESIKKMRPDDVAVNAAISDEENKDADFYVFNLPALNTLSKEEADLRVHSGHYKLVETKKIKLLTVEYIIQNYLNDSLPHLISLDVEGMDYKILSSFNFEKYPVPVWIVETCEYSENHIKPKVTPIIDLMLKKGYFVFADTYINTVFVNKLWFDNYGKS